MIWRRGTKSTGTRQRIDKFCRRATGAALPRPPSVARLGEAEDFLDHGPALRPPHRQALAGVEDAGGLDVVDHVALLSELVHRAGHWTDVESDRLRAQQIRDGREAEWQELTVAQIEDAGQQELMTWICDTRTLEHFRVTFIALASLPVHGDAGRLPRATRKGTTTLTGGCSNEDTQAQRDPSSTRERSVIHRWSGDAADAAHARVEQGLRFGHRQLRPWRAQQNAHSQQ